MNTSEFIKIKKTAKEPQFKELIGLTESGNTSLLCDFCTLMHPNQCKIAQGSKCNVHTDKSHFLYTLYTNCILKTNVYTGKKTLYSLN